MDSAAVLAHTAAIFFLGTLLGVLTMAAVAVQGRLALSSNGASSETSHEGSSRDRWLAMAVPGSHQQVTAVNRYLRKLNDHG